MALDSLEYPFKYASYFIPEFIYRMRRSPDCQEKPSPRQAITMGRLLLPSYLRKGHLRFEDLLNAAVVTSVVDNQRLAEKVGVEVLLNADFEEETYQEGDELLSLLAKRTDDDVYATPQGKGAENDFAALHDSDADIFNAFQNKPDIGVGPGEDEILRVGVRALRERSERNREIIARLLKERLMKLGRELERREAWERNPALRPFEAGEDPDLIEEERSLENILDLGRGLEEIRYDDFLMRKREKRRRNIVYIQDVSNTMFYDLEGINSINYSVMSLVPLIWALRRESYGLVLYESNSHVVKDIMEDADTEGIIEELIYMITYNTTEMEKRFGRTAGSLTWGGTVPQKSLSWAYDQLVDLNERSERLCFIFSDFVLSDPGTEMEENLRNYSTMERMMDQGIRVMACVSPLAEKELFKPYTEQALDKLRKMGCFIAYTSTPSDFIDEAQKFIEQR